MSETACMPQKPTTSYLVASESLIEERIEGAGDTFLVPFLDGFLYYSPLANVSMILDGAAAAAVRKYFRKEPLLPDEQSLLDDLGQRDVFKIQIPEATPGTITNARNQWAPTRATFSTTQKCSLRCKYCYAEGGRLEDLDIPLPVAQAAIDLIVKNAKAQQKSPSISFLGEGEATSNWRAFRNIIEYFKNQCRLNQFKPGIYLCTNGVFSQSRLHFIAENCTNITFSLDGVRAVHDENRVLPNGGGSFNRIIANMKALELLGKTYEIRSTVTVAGVSSLTEFVRFVGENLQCKSIHFEPVFDVTAVTRLEGRIEHLGAQRFVDHFRQARRVAAGFGIELYYSGSAMIHRQSFCGAGSAGTFLVTSRGIVTSCSEVLQPWDIRAKLFQYGQWHQEAGKFIINQKSINRLRRLNVHEMPKCQGCIAKYNCAGDCYAKSASLNGDPVSAAYTQRCHITRELLKDNLLLGLISEKVGINDGDGSDRTHCPL